MWGKTDPHRVTIWGGVVGVVHGAYAAATYYYLLLGLGARLASVRVERRRSTQCTSDAKPRNPCHVDRFEGGRKRVSDTFTHKNSVSCI